MTSAALRRNLVVAALALGMSCKDKTATQVPLPDGGATPVTYFTAQLTDKTFYVADHFLASIEMQISGEPFAQLLGRDLAGYDRFSTTPDLYIDPATGQSIVDPLSYSMAIESYEYSTQPMNNTSFESGAGVALAYGPVLNPTNMGSGTAFTLLHDRVQLFALASSSGGPPGTNFVVSPSPTDNPLNVYGWPGFFPVFLEFKQFAPDVEPSAGATRGCSFAGGYAAAAMGAQIVGDYECGYNSLNLPNREMQVVKLLEPDALGFAMWKQGLWVINYWQSMHDLAGNGITQIADADLAKVGQPGNQVVGQYADPGDPTGKTMLDGAPGVYLGDIPLEGFQGLTMLDEMHNKSALMLQSLLTSDGVHLGGFASTKAAIAYDYKSPLQWWPSSIAVTETGTAAPPSGLSWQLFPQPTAFAIKSASSRLHGLTALAGGFAEMFALTDFNNPDVGGQPSSRATFDGDPFPADNLLPDGEDTPHDRALANLKLAVVNMDRLHYDAANHVMVDEATVSGGAVQHGQTVSALVAAYSIVGLRTALRSISSSLTLYSNDTPDTIGAPTALDGAPLAGAPAPLPARMLQLIRAQADFIVAKLVASDGAVANSYDLGAGAADAAPTRLESEASVVRGLLDAYLATSDTKYRVAAMRVWADLDQRFWMSDVRAYRTTAGVSDTLTWTPLALGTIQGAMRQYWKIVGKRPGNEQLAAELLERVQRTNKLVLNGWDDANADNKVQYPDECTGAGLQMAERALTGELSHPADGPDRDHDCVKEASAAKLPAALAGQIVLKRR
jgi:hypothetical protein